MSALRKPGSGKLTVCGVVLVIASIQFAGAADLAPAGYRLSNGLDKFKQSWQVAAVFRTGATQILASRNLELAAGVISSPSCNEVFVSLGPNWHWPVHKQKIFLEIGFSPTLISGSTFDDRDIGGNFHFTSSIALGARFGREENILVALRIQHISNGGLASPNPGLDMVGINFRFGRP